jgi:hypothetical protein
MSNTQSKAGLAIQLGDIVGGALLATAPVAPLVAALLVVAAALRGELPQSWFTYLPSVMLLPGMVYLLAAWLLLALIWSVLGFTHVKRANAATYCELANELTESQTMLDRLDPAAKTTARHYLGEVERALEGSTWSRATWVLGNGYVSVWQLLHRAQEALIGLEPLDAVVARAHYDLLRLAKSHVLHRDLLRERLSQSIDLLTPVAADSVDLEARARVLDVLKETGARQDWGPSTNTTDAEGWLAQLDKTLHAVSAAPIGSEHKLPLVYELRAAVRELRTSLDATPGAGALEAGTAASNGARPAQLAREALPTATVAVSATAEQSATETRAATDVAAPAAPNARTYALKNRVQLAEQLGKLIDYLTQLPREAAKREPSVIETTVVRVRDDAALRAPEFVAEARIVVGTIRQTLNEYRDESRAGLVRARNKLGWTTVVTALFAYAVLWLALASSVPIEAIKVAVSYFLVGALIGLFSRLNGELGADSATEDYGLSVMRLIAAPQLAGVAAVAGVGLLALTGMTAAEVAGAPNSFVRAFMLPFQPATMLAAAGFGLAPGLLIERLKQQTETLKGNLKSTQPQSGAASR